MDRRGSVNSTGEVFSFDHVRRKSTKEEKLETKFAVEEGKVITYNGPKFGKRHIEIVGFFIMFLINQIQRQHISLTIVAMTDPKANSNMNITTFDWNNKNVILSSFFWGYISPQVFCGVLLTRYGPKWIVITCTAITSLLSILLPWLAVHSGSAAVIACRALQGVTQAMLIPSCSCFVSRWIPISERGRAGGFIAAGSPLATVTSMSLSGVMSASAYGWPMTFIVYGLLGLLWSLYYAFFGYNSPAAHKSMTKAEKSFIMESAVDTTRKAQSTPWRKMLTSPPIWSLSYCMTCWVLVSWILLTEIPTYMSKIMMFNINSNGLLTALIYLMQCISTMVTSTLSDYLINKSHLSITLSRKVFTTVGMSGAAVSLIFLAQCTEETSTRGVILLMVATGSLGFSLSGIGVNNLDLAPNHVSVLQGILNGFSHIFAMLAPLVVQFMVYDEHSPEQWKKVFYLASAVSLSGVVIFDIFGSGDEQAWNQIEDDEDTEDPLNN